ncbi:hypothetical protein N752_05340 [Desulforamulus aquiferis]|nr:hypothetical protein N752_05340 [Desulforamulus aquiferis]
MSYELKEETGGTPITVSIAGDSGKLLDNIKGFIDKYNELIDKINGALTEKSYQYATKGQSAYKPLTDEERSSMSEKDIELWEEKARSGLLRSDPLLQKALSSLRGVLYEKVEGLDISLYDIGITTSDNWLDGGKLVIDEQKLMKAIQDMPDKVVTLFTQQSSISYDDGANRATRIKQEGIAWRLFDVIEDNIRVTRDSQGNKGALLQKAGMDGDTTDLQNYITKQMEDQQKMIDKMLEKLIDKENQYYKMFSAMETAIQRMSSSLPGLHSNLVEGNNERGWDILPTSDFRETTFGF